MPFCVSGRQMGEYYTQSYKSFSTVNIFILKLCLISICYSTPFGSVKYCQLNCVRLPKDAFSDYVFDHITLTQECSLLLSNT